MQWFNLEGSVSNFSWTQTQNFQTTSDGIVAYSFLDEINVSAEVGSIEDRVSSIVEEKLLLPQNSFGFWYFEELLDTLSFERHENKGSNVFLLPEYVFTYIQTQVVNLNAFECKNLLIQIDKIIVWLAEATNLISAHYHIRSIIFKRLEELVENPSIPENNNSEETWEIIYLWELLQWPAERTRFIPIENQNPAFTQKIDAYRNRVQHGIWSLANETFSPTFDIIFKICSTILQSRDKPEFPRDTLIEWISGFSLFECQYMLEWVNEVIYPEHQTNLIHTMAYVHLIKWYLEIRIAEIQNN